VTQQKPYQLLAWLGTATILIGSVLAAFNIYPVYLYVFLVANGIWATVGWLWREQSLVILNAGITVVYLLGLYFK
jgi:hypothetical protein